MPKPEQPDGSDGAESLDPGIINMLRFRTVLRINAKDEDGNTSLILAATRNSNPKVVDTLIQARCR